MRRKKTVLFLQLPLLDNDVGPAHENVPLAARYLAHRVVHSPESKDFTCRVLPPSADHLDDCHLVRAILARHPDVLAATLYLWNIERTLAVVAATRKKWPSMRVVVGGPEVAPDHPFLFSSGRIDAAVAGDGEAVFPVVLSALLSGRDPNLRNVAWRTGNDYRWGRNDPAVLPLADLLPPPSWRGWKPDARGMAYLEASRGCPLRCAYCCYSRWRTRPAFLPAGRVVECADVLRRRGAREIRFVDPTFNAHPEFEQILDGLIRLNRGRRIRLFGEIRADRLAPGQAKKLAAAGFREVEVGAQTLDPGILKSLRRPADIPKLEKGIRDLVRAGIRVTGDLMYGLPGQTLGEVRRSARWARRLGRIRLQGLRTLALPGTELWTRTGKRFQCLENPPYAVVSTREMSESDLARAEEILEQASGLSYDPGTRRFVGARLPDLFPERVSGLSGRENRRALLFRGRNLFGRRERIAETIRKALCAEPHILWQFVLAPECEEPLDLLDRLVAEIRSFPPQIQDRLLGARKGARIASRRLFILSPRRASRTWTAAAEALLRGAFV